MEMGFTLDMCACILLLVLIFSHFQNELWTISDRVFSFVLIACFIASTTDAIHRFIDGNQGISQWFFEIINICYFLSRNATPFFYLFYIITLMDGGNTIRKKSSFWWLYLPMIVDVSIILSNPLTDYVFYYDENNFYHRGEYIGGLYFIAAYYLVLGLVFVVKYQHVISVDKQRAFYFFFPISVMAVLIQMVYPAFAVEMFATSICLLLLMFTIQRKEEIIDGSTGLWNRVLFMQDIHRFFYNKVTFSIINIEMTNLHVLNETMGWMAVDGIIKETAQYIKKFRSQCDGLYSLGNGKFNLIFLSKTIKNAEKLAEEINKRFRKSWKYNEAELKLSVKVSTIKCPEEVSDKDDLMEFIDEFDKRKVSRNRVLHMNDFDKQKVRHRRELEQIIEKAWNEGNFEVYYQPIYSIKEKRFTSAEALLRLKDEKYGFIPPDEFIPVAEENMSILKIGKFVLESVCEFLIQNNLKEKGIQYIEVNLSVIQCMQVDMPEQLMEIIKSYGVKPQQINLEITETATIYSPETVLKNMEILRKNGIECSLDDYGSGNSNLDYLLKFPFGLIKLDKGIIGDSNVDQKRKIALVHTIEMLKEMGYHIVAEGVETKEMVEALSEMGCQYLQGYFFSRPVPAEEFLKYLSEA